ncbi:hypothetical protein PC129_g18883 [Phytophthora cactorum]|uniref:Reverse transcriptase RNase H-like domain-containing protein n=2 Tax=Phytophthora cactorum TaxID=29920 RepID=A0A8T1HCX7_9STRA|nr:hypothetical protein PC111_g22835 [Phytophthora cactorum]KAG2836754.1 hypothetical protein PC113_g19967 [Phytophthora cactorum]KAG2873568.1 hypothetical protein PC114_g25783 [Phytophthora cactorum]KAG2979158.1 hypothetical protein PC119_g21568 [Phytophthora cactorum]KAG3050647.1 hypothetical protein PC122_g23196 [Phytophthora cactorum]
MQDVDKRDRTIAYASKMLVGSQRNWVNKTSGTTEIECWGIALTRSFGENTRISNAKLAWWAMDLSQLRFKVHHRPGTSMGHADGLSRLYHRPGASVVGAIRMSDLLNANENDASIRDGTQTQDGTINRNATDVPVAVGEPNVTPRGEPAEGVPPSEEAPMGTKLLTQAEQEEDLQGRTQEVDPSPIDAFGLDYDGFVAEHERVPWMRALKAFLNDGALASDSQLRVSGLKMSPHYLIWTLS